MQISSEFADGVGNRPFGPRTFRSPRKRTRVWSASDTKNFLPGRLIVEEEMETRTEKISQHTEPDDLIDRATLCLPHLGKDVIVHGGDEGFKDVLRQYFPSAESNALERLVKLKSKLRASSTHDFWGILMEEMCEIVGSQCGFVAKRMLVDDQDSAVEMPELGEDGSCLMSVAFYTNGGTDVKQLKRDYQYHAYGTPCAYMKHDKVFIVPEKLAQFTPNNPNPMPWNKSEAFIGLPLFAEGKCFAHFCMIWSEEGASKRKLSWSFIEMFMHSLEDLILQRILEGRGFVKETTPLNSLPAKVIPLSAIAATQSLKPYARSLSHELRTPMQGVIGMLDIMYATVCSAVEDQQNASLKDVFAELKSGIESVQDSSRRAVEAADNVVHAYDLNMQMPEMTLQTGVLASDDARFGRGSQTGSPRSPQVLTTSGSQSSPSSRKRDRSEDLESSPGPSLKRLATVTEPEIPAMYHSDETSITSGGATFNSAAPSEMDWNGDKDAASPKGFTAPIFPPPCYQQVNMKYLIKSLLNEALRNDHATEELQQDTALGFVTNIRNLGPRGEVQNRIVRTEIDPDVPGLVLTEEQPLRFALQKLIDNAIKFTELGCIKVTVKMSSSSQFVEIRVEDTGCGISEEAKSKMFEPHFQQDSSLSRAKDGLGLSLFNAKAHVRRNLNGELTLERSSTHGPLKGSVFLIRLRLSTSESAKYQTPSLVSSPTAPRRTKPALNSGSEPIPTAAAIPNNSTQTRPSLTKSSSTRKRPVFNPNLSAEYPLNILIAEDNEVNRRVIVGTLGRLGFKDANITVSFDGCEAVEHYKASLKGASRMRFDCILMDIWMPNMDGYEATKTILDLANDTDTPPTIIAITADITEESHRRATQSGMRGLLAKPYKVIDIEHLIKKHFEPCRP